MADLFENPIGLDGFEFLEFTAPKKGMLEPIFEAMGLDFYGGTSEQCTIISSRSLALEARGHV